ncbi:MAG: thioesterase [Rubricoccaceae bacterium]|nr:thioesterase [Rubricoccaceae bacterium]
MWHEHLRVRAYEAGPDGRVSVLPLLDYCQEAASNHARALGVMRFDLDAGPGHWVLRRLRLAVDRYPETREAVTVETWPSTENGLRVDRDFVITDGDGASIARVSSTWYILDLVRRRPVRIPEWAQVVRLPERPRALPPSSSEPRPPDRPDHRRHFHVRRTDLDLAGHANNARYVEWAVETLPDALFDACELATVDILFRGEANRGDVVVCEASAEQEGVYAHRLGDDADGRTLAVLRTTWRPNASSGAARTPRRS